MATVKHLGGTDASKDCEGDVEPGDPVQNFPGPVGFQDRASRGAVKLVNQVAEGCSRMSNR